MELLEGLVCIPCAVKCCGGRVQSNVVEYDILVEYKTMMVE